MSFIQPDFYNDIVFDLEILKPETANIDSIANVVTKVYFLLKGTYDGVVYEHENELEFLTDTIDLDNVTDFNSLTESQVKSWVETNKPMDALKHSIAVQIKENIESTDNPNFAFQETAE